MSSLTQSLLVLKWGRMLQGDSVDIPKCLCLSDTRGRHTQPLECVKANWGLGVSSALISLQRYNEAHEEITTFSQYTDQEENKTVGNVWPAKSERRLGYLGDLLGKQRG